MKVVKIVLFVFLSVTVVLTAFTSGFYVAGQTDTTSAAAAFQLPSARAATSPNDVPKQFQTLNEVWRVLREEFIDGKDLDADKLGKAAIDGMLSALDDRHTHFLDRQTREAENSALRGSYEGIGAHVQMDEGVLTIVAPLAGSPAEAAGIRAGDKILALDGVNLQGMNLSEAVAKVKGPKGSKITLTIQRQGSSTQQPIEVTRDEIKTASVVLGMQPDGFAHIRISQFGQRTADELRDALSSAKRQNAKGLVLDLRNNPGGLLDATVEITNMFLDGGIAGYQVDKNGKRETLRLSGKGEYTDIPLAVLVNGGSASGSELLAGALQDRNRAKLVGTTTYGKGSVNHLKELTDRSALYVTIGRWLTPNGRLIEGNGLTPDFLIAITEDDIKAMRDVAAAMAPNSTSPSVALLDADPQMKKARELLRGGGR